MQVREDLKRSRDARVLAAEREWRGYVEQIARGEMNADDVGEQVDWLLLKLQLPLESFISDVEAMREHGETCVRIKNFVAAEHEHDALRKRAKAKVAKLRAEGESFALRFATAETAELASRRPYGNHDRDQKRLAVLERENSRLFGELGNG